MRRSKSPVPGTETVPGLVLARITAGSWNKQEMLELLLRITSRKINVWLDEIFPRTLEFGPGLFGLCCSSAGQGTAVAGCSHHPSPSCATSSSESIAGGHSTPCMPPGSVAASFSVETPFQPPLQVIRNRKEQKAHPRR